MPNHSRWVFPLTPAFVEYIHDQGLAMAWPGIQPVKTNDCISIGLLESAVNLPFQTAFQVECYPTVLEKASCLFHSLNANHCFGNGNKRTAVLAVDQFLLANSYFLALSNEGMYELAIQASSYKEKNIKPSRMLSTINAVIGTWAFPFELAARHEDWTSRVRWWTLQRRQIRNDERNRPGYPMNQKA